MKRILSGKNNKDTEFSSDTLINPMLTGIPHQRTVNSTRKPTITEQQQEAPLIDDFDEKRSRK